MRTRAKKRGTSGRVCCEAKRPPCFTTRWRGTQEPLDPRRGIRESLPAHDPYPIHRRFFVPLHLGGWAAAGHLHADYERSRSALLGRTQRSAVDRKSVV